MTKSTKVFPILIIFLVLFFPIMILSVQAGQAQAQPAVPMIYWTDRDLGTVNRANLDGSGMETLLELGSYSRPRGLTLDMRSDTVYFISDQGDSSRRIYRMDLDGGNLQEIVNSYLEVRFPNQLAVDPLQNQLVWSDSGRDAIGRSNLDGSAVSYQLVPGPEEGNAVALDATRRKIYWDTSYGLFRSDLDGSHTQRLPMYHVYASAHDFAAPPNGLEMFENVPSAFAVDEVNGKYYYSLPTRDQGRGYAIYRGDLDGSNVELVIPDSDGRTGGIAFDTAAGKMYWTVGHSQPQIRRANLDGSSPEAIINDLTAPLDLDLDLTNGQMYWTDWADMTIQRADINGGTAEVVVETAPYHPRYLTLDVPAGMLYWTSDGGEAVWQANLDGSNAAPLIDELASTRGIVLDQASGKLIWMNLTTQTISKADKEGGAVEDIIIRRLDDPQGVVINEITGQMVWADFAADKILRANPYGSHFEELITTGLDLPTSMALDSWARQMYWADGGLGQIGRANLDGSDPVVLLSRADGLDKPGHVALDLSAGKIYWSDHGTRTISRANLDGSEIEVIISSGLSVPSSLALSLPPTEIWHSYAPMLNRSG